MRGARGAGLAPADKTRKHANRHTRKHAYMHTLAFYSSKGGAGKTTLAVHVAVAAQTAGGSVAVLDADPQGSSLAWASARESETPVVVGCSPGRIREALSAAREDGHTHALIDPPPHALRAARELLAVADLVVIPVRPSVLDLAALPQAAQLVLESGRPAVLVLSAARPRMAELSEVRRALENGYPWPVAETVVHDRAAFARALASGQAVAEFEPSGTAALEIRNLWRELQAILKTLKQANT